MLNFPLCASGLLVSSVQGKVQEVSFKQMLTFFFEREERAFHPSVFFLFHLTAKTGGALGLSSRFSMSSESFY